MSSLPEASNIQLANQTAEGVFKQFNDTMKLLATTSDNRVLRMWREDLTDLHEHAQHLLLIDSLDPYSRSKLKLLTQRPVEEWEIIAQGRNKAHVSY